MFVIKTNDVKPYVSAFENILAFKKHTRVLFDKQGILVKTIDDNHVMLIAFSVAKDDTLEFTSPDDINSCVVYDADIKNLIAVMKLGIKRGPISLKVADEPRELQMILSNTELRIPPSVEKIENHDDLELPDENWDIDIIISIKDAKRLFKDVSTVADEFVLECDAENKSVKLKCKSSKADAIFDMSSENDIEVKYIKKCSIIQKFDAKYMFKIIKADIGNKHVNIRVRDGMFIEVRHPFG